MKKIRPEVQASIERSLREHAEVWRLLAGYDAGTLTPEEMERITRRNNPKDGDGTRPENERA
jgi:hypothetical protein